MLPGISSTETMARKRAATGAQVDRDEGEQIPIPEMLFQAIKKYATPAEGGVTQRQAADDFDCAPATITNVLHRRQPTLNRELYMRVCKKLGFDVRHPLEQLVALGGELDVNDLVNLVAIAKSLARKP